MLKGIFTGTLYKLEISPAIMRMINLLYYRTSMTVDLVLVGKNVETDEDFLSDIPHNQLHYAKDFYEIETLLTSGVIAYYITNSNEYEQIGGKYCLTLDGFNNLLDKGLKRL